MLTAADAARLRDCIAAGGVAIVPTDTVYGLAAAADDETAVRRLYELKRRPLEQPSAVMFLSLDAALAALPELSEPPLRALLPGAVSVLVPNPRRRFWIACGRDPETLGLRVPRLDAAPFDVPVVQSSANFHGGTDPRALDEVPDEIRAAADLELDGGELPGTPSTVVDLRDFEADGSWEIVREGALSAAQIAAVLATPQV